VKDLTARRRDHEENHARSPSAQTLDALLRIEELLTKLVAAKDPQVELEQMVEAEKAAKTAPAKPKPSGRPRVDRL
jgi:hypothetical protein